MAATYANERKAFGKSLSDFGMIKKKLAYMAADVYAAEAIAFRTVGLTLKLWLSDRQAGSFAFHAEDINS